MKLTRYHTQDLFDELERDGIIAKNGETRPGRHGRPQPVYVITPLGKALNAEADGRAPKTSENPQ